MGKERRLGRGLDSLIPSLAEKAPTPTPAAAAHAEREVPLRLIELNPVQPRAEIDPEELQGLADSIRAAGVIQPILLRPAGERYELVVGERRVRACRLAGRDTVPALVRDIPDEEMLTLALVENIQRADLNPIEKAQAVRRMMDDLGLTQEQVGHRLGFQRSTIANLLRLLDLSPDLQDVVSRGTLSAGHARALLSLPSTAARRRLASQIEMKGLSVREAERLAASSVVTHGPRPRYEPSPHLLAMEEQLALALGARVQISPKRKGGKVVIHFADADDFERIYGLLLLGADTPEIGD